MMIKRTIFTICLASMVLGFTQKGFSQEKMSVDKVIAKVGNSSILYSEVVEASDQLVENYRENGMTPPRDPFAKALEGLLEMKLGYNQSQIDSLTINTSNVVSRVDEIIRMYVGQLGSMAALEKFAHMPVFELRQNLTRKLEEQQYFERMRETVTGKVKITPGEVEKYYKTFSKDSIPIVPEQYIYAQIVRYPPSMDEAKQRVREKLLDMRERLISGDVQFPVLVRLYSEAQDGSVERGGEMMLEKVGMEEQFAKVVTNLKPGQVSEIIETEQGFHIVELLNVTDGRYHFRQVVLKPQFLSEEIGSTLAYLDSIAHKIRVDSISFEAAARRFSDDSGTKMNGGIVNNNELLGMMQGFANAADASYRFMKEDFQYNLRDYQAILDLEQGEISNAFESRDLKGNTLAKIIKLVQKFPTHQANLNDDYLVIERMALRNKQYDAYVKWLNKTIDATYIRIDPAYYSQIENKRWIK